MTHMQLGMISSI